MEIPQTDVVLRHEGCELARVTLPPGEYVIGRSAEVAICVDTPLLSRQHALLVLNFDSIHIEDLGSSNGTFVGDQPVTELVRLFPNQSVRLGDVALEVRRLRSGSASDFSLAPVQKAIRRHLPPEILADKRYAIGSIVARGGMGAILDARQNANKRTVAMKVMLDTNDEGDVLRFIEEAQITSQLEHPNIVPIYELGVDEQDQLFYTMKMVKGITLKKVLELLANGVSETVKKFPLPALLTIFQKVCDAIAFAHSKGVIHRDLKPENLMLGDFGSVLVMDWGLAKLISNRDAPATDLGRSLVTSARAAAPDLSSTMTGTILGTPQYMAPEQARGEVETLDQRADIYALGAILFHLLFLRAPIGGSDAMQVVDKVARGELEWPTAKELRAMPDSLLAVCRKALALDPAARYARTEELQADILAYQNGFATSAEHAGWFKRTTLAIKRNKTASAAAGMIVALSMGFTAKVIAEGRRAERALSDLKASAPALLQLAENEADSQRFESALGKLDAALALDSALHRARWQRAWVLLALDRWSDAADALRLARQHDPAHPDFASILPLIEELGAAPAEKRWTAPRADAVLRHFTKVGANAEAIALSRKMQAKGSERARMAAERVTKANVGGGVYNESNGYVFLKNLPDNIDNIEFVRGLPIDAFVAPHSVKSLEPLRGMPLRRLELYGCSQIEDFGPLQGMPLEHLSLFGAGKFRDLTILKGMPLTTLRLDRTSVTDLDRLRGLRLESLNLNYLSISDLSPLRGMPLHELYFANTAVKDLSLLADFLLETLDVKETEVQDLGPLRHCPLYDLRISRTRVRDLSPLRGLPLVRLNMEGSAGIADLAPLAEMLTLENVVLPPNAKNVEVLRSLTKLKYLDYKQLNTEGASKPVAEFWKDYDLQQATGRK